MAQLLTRDDFREGVFARDGHRCVVCKAPAVDAHHLLERRLWGNGGYFLENGVSVCEEHHLEAEATTLSCEKLREFAGIKTVLLPEHLAEDVYDKWGNPVLPNGMRLRGELFDEAPVQKMLAPVLALFSDRVKYPRSYHLPWSPGVTDDDRVVKDVSHFEGRDVVVTVKMDGECSTLYTDYVHARSIDYEPHESRSWLKALHGRMGHEIPKSWRICGENVYARHSIAYEHLADYFQLFGVWNEKNVCLSWDETIEWAGLLGLTPVTVRYRGIWDEKTIRYLHAAEVDGDPCEGYVVRLADAFPYRDFRRAVAKYVRKHHVTTSDHWMRSRVVPNGLRSRA